MHGKKRNKKRKKKAPKIRKSKLLMLSFLRPPKDTRTVSVAYTINDANGKRHVHIPPDHMEDGILKYLLFT